MVHALILGALTVLALPWLLPVAWMRSRRPSSPQRALVIQSGKIGDLVCMTPLFRALHEHGADVTVLCLRRTASVLLNNPHVKTFLYLDEERFRGIVGSLRLWTVLLRSHFSVSIVPLPGSRHSMIGLWAAAPVRLLTVGWKHSLSSRCFGVWQQTVRYERHMRTFDHYMRLAQALGVPRTDYRHDIFLTGDERRFAEAWLAERGIDAEIPFTVLALTAGNRLKEWPLERFVAVARHLRERWGLRILFTAMDRSVTGRAAAGVGSGDALEAYDLTLRQLAAVIGRAALFVSVDTGPLYIAHALGVPVVDIVGPVDPAEQPPVPGERVAIVVPPSPCRPTSFVAETGRLSSEEQHAAIALTTVAMVITAVDILLKRVSH